MTRQNRVLPTGEIVAVSDRGMVMGNRGVLHDETKTLGEARWRHAHWICCVLSFKGRKREVMQPGAHYTELFFLDDAVALAAGHRPCAECRRADYNSYRGAWSNAFGITPKATDMDRVLHKSRVESRTKRQIRHQRDAATLPDGAFISVADAPLLVLGDHVLPWTTGGYLAPQKRPVGRVTVLTPAPSVAVLAAGFRPQLHPSAD